MKRFNKFFTILMNALIYTFLFASLLFAAFSFYSKKSSNGEVEVFGYQLRTVATESMEECQYTDVSGYDIKSIPVHSMVFIQLAPSEKETANEWYKALKIGDVLTFNYVYVGQSVITHRIVRITEKNTGGYIIELSGDNKMEESAALTQIIDTSLVDSPNHVIGKVVRISVFLGAIVTYLSNPLTVALCIIIPCFTIIVFQVFKMLQLKMENKLRKKEEEIKILKEQINKLKKAPNRGKGYLEEVFKINLLGGKK